MAMDAVLVNTAFFLAFWLRFDGVIPAHYIDIYLQITWIFTLVLIACFYFFGLYRCLWQYASIGELVSVIEAVTAGLLINVCIAYFWMQGNIFPLPRSVFILVWMLDILLIGGLRLSLRLIRDQRLSPVYYSGTGSPVLIVGAGDAGAAVARELRNHTADKRIPVGLIDDDPAKQKQEMFGLQVLGQRKDIPRLVRSYMVEEIIFAIPSAPGTVVKETLEICNSTGARLKIVPGIYELIDGYVSVSQIRDVQVEDLLGRAPVQVDLQSMSGYISGKVVLVTGAGGSIGSELCRQISGFDIDGLLLLGHGENSIYHIHRELAGAYPDLDLKPLIVDIKDAAAIDRVFKQCRPQVVFHAAAHKHVPLMEHNAVEAIKNNVLGTRHLCSAANKHGVETFVLISSDKAVKPSSIMGATKRVAEMVLQSMNSQGNTVFAAVRFGNVLGSSGSVVPLFKEQIKQGGPVTVTHPEMTRFFMTIPEAVQLVIQAGAFASGGEIFVLDMGEPVRITDLARNMIRLSGFEPGKDIEIVYTGVRPGEKMREELLTASEEVSATRHQRIFVAEPDEIDQVCFEKFFAMLFSMISQNGFSASREDAIVLLQTVLPGFRE